jgi:uncharacterized SAM-binding protein YcdF (DUF218 family)
MYKKWLFSFLFLFILGGVFFSIQSLFKNPAPARTKDHYDAIICLAGGKGRMLYAFELFREGFAEHLFFSGTDSSFSWNDLTKRLQLDEKEPFKKRIFLDNTSRSTIENAFLSLQFVRKKNHRNILLVTSDYHMKRSYLIFRKIFPSTIHIYTEITPSKTVTAKNWWRSLIGWRLLTLEWLKWVRTKWLFLLWSPLDREDYSDLTKQADLSL